jgi:hypothetical protein
MAALTLVAGAVFASHASADDKLVVPEVELDVAVAGLGAKGCKVEVKPGSPTCRFKTITKDVDSRGLAKLTLKDVETHNADHDCTFSITVKEPGHPDKTVLRGLRLSKPIEGRPARAPVLSCYISSPSKVARAEAAARGRDRVRR